MSSPIKHGVRLLTLISLLACAATAQVMSIPSSAFGNIGTDAGGPGAPIGIGALSSEQITNELWWLNGRQAGGSPLNSPMGSVSALDLKAPGKARKEFAKGYQLLTRKDYSGAVASLTSAISIYPDFVAAHNALGSAYMGLGQNQKARDAIRQSRRPRRSFADILFQSRLRPTGPPGLCLRRGLRAESRFAGSCDLQLATALAYAQFMNQDYSAVLATTPRCTNGSIRAPPWSITSPLLPGTGRTTCPKRKIELQTLLQEDPKSPAAEQARNLLLQMKSRPNQERRTDNRAPTAPPRAGRLPKPRLCPLARTAGAAALLRRRWQLRTPANKNRSPKPKPNRNPSARPARSTIVRRCRTACRPPPGLAQRSADTDQPQQRPLHPAKGSGRSRRISSPPPITANPSPTSLPTDIGIRDDQKSPAVVTGFRNQAQLPLRLGIIIDTSESVSQPLLLRTARRRPISCRRSLPIRDDLAFVVGSANSFF